LREAFKERRIEVFQFWRDEGLAVQKARVPFSLRCEKHRIFTRAWKPLSQHSDFTVFDRFGAGRRRNARFIAAVFAIADVVPAAAGTNPSGRVARVSVRRPAAYAGRKSNLQVEKGKCVNGL
jgi:hypothetical protein